VINHLSPEIPAIVGTENERIATYSTSVPPRDIVESILKYDVRLKRIKNAPAMVRRLLDELQRGAVKKDRTDAHVNYITSREQMKHIWAYPAIAIAVQEAPQVRKAFPDNPNLPFVFVQLRRTGFRVINDGIGRVGGLVEFEDILEDPNYQDEAVKAIVKRVIALMSLPLVIFAPREGAPDFTEEDVAQLFSDFNFKVRPVSQAKAMQTDSSDIYLQLANAIGNIPVIRNNGGMESGKTSVGKNSTAYVTEAMLYRTVRGACEGESAQETNAIDISDANLTPATYQREFSNIEDFFTEVANAMGAKWLDKNGVHRTAPGWQALGVICNDIHHGELTLTPAQISRVYSALGYMDWSRSNPKWVTDAKIGEFDADKGLVFHKAGRTTRHNLITYLRRETGLQSLIEQRVSGAV
jgi:hypothetical protein